MDRISDGGIHTMKETPFFLELQANDDGDRFEKEQERLRFETALEEYKNSGVPKKFFSADFDSFVAGNEVESMQRIAVEKYCKQPGNKVLILCGRNGNGKSLLGCCVIKNFGGRYVWSSKMCVEYEAGTSYHAKRTREELLDFYSNLPMLVIDECGKYTLDEEVEKFILSYIIVARYENNLPTVLITNAEKKDFVDFLGKAVFDRLTEVCISLEFKEESKRKSMRNV